MPKIRGVKKIFEGALTRDGAGVSLRRVFGYHQVPMFDPFLMLDEFKSENSADYLGGFPWHPHRGIETVTYIVSGKVEHGDSLGNKGVISDGDCQWMTAGSGIIHQEMPQKSELLWGYQLWVNLPAKDKMTEPKYRDIKGTDVPVLDLEGKGRIKLICGTYSDMEGPVKGITMEPVFFDVELKAGCEFSYEIAPDKNAFVHIMQGEGFIGEAPKEIVGKSTAVLLDEGEQLMVRAGEEGVRFLLVAANPINEPVAWGGPIVMNTREELDTAFEEYNNGTFIKVGKGIPK